MSNGILILFLLHLVLRLTVGLKKNFIKLKQRPILTFHGFMNSCESKDYTIYEERYNAICFEYGAGSESNASYLKILEESCKKFKRMIAEGDKFRNGFYVLAFSHGGIVSRYLLQYCPAFRQKIRRLVTFASPHLGISEGPNLFSLSNLKLLFKNLGKIPGFVKDNVSPKGRRPNELSMKDLFHEKLGHSMVFRQMSYDSYRANNTHYQQLELFMNVVNDREEFVLPKETASFGAKINPEEGFIQQFSKTQAYKLNLFGLQHLYDRGAFLNCIAKGSHGYNDRLEEEEHIFELLKDNCLFDTSKFDDRSEEQLYELCLAIKLVHNDKTTAMKCDPTVNQLKNIAHLKKSLKGMQVKHGNIKPLK